MFLNTCVAYNHITFSFSRQLSFDRCSCSQHKYWAFHNILHWTKYLSAGNPGFITSVKQCFHSLYFLPTLMGLVVGHVKINWLKIIHTYSHFTKDFHQISAIVSTLLLNVFLASSPLLLLVAQNCKQLINGPLSMACYSVPYVDFYLFYRLIDVTLMLYKKNMSSSIIIVTSFGDAFANTYWREVMISVWQQIVNRKIAATH